MNLNLQINGVNRIEVLDSHNQPIENQNNNACRLEKPDVYKVIVKNPLGFPQSEIYIDATEMPVGDDVTEAMFAMNLLNSELTRRNLTHDETESNEFKTLFDQVLMNQQHIMRFMLSQRNPVLSEQCAKKMNNIVKEDGVYRYE